MIGQVFKLKEWQYGNSANRLVMDEQTKQEIDIPLGSNLILTRVTKNSSLSKTTTYWSVSYDFLFGTKIIKLIHVVGDDKEAASEFIRCFDKIS